MYVYLHTHVHELKLVCVKLHSLGFTSSHIAVTASFDVVTKSSSTSDYVVTNNSACTSRVMSSQTVAQHNHCALTATYVYGNHISKQYVRSYIVLSRIIVQCHKQLMLCWNGGATN